MFVACSSRFGFVVLVFFCFCFLSDLFPLSAIAFPSHLTASFGTRSRALRRADHIPHPIPRFTFRRLTLPEIKLLTLQGASLGSLSGLWGTVLDGVAWISGVSATGKEGGDGGGNGDGEANGDDLSASRGDGGGDGGGGSGADTRGGESSSRDAVRCCHRRFLAVETVETVEIVAVDETAVPFCFSC